MPLYRFALAVLFLASIVRSEAACAQVMADVYRHPDGLFSLSVPQGAAAQAGEGPIAVRMTSVHGWTVTVQTGKATPNLDLGGMVARLEERYLGPTRAWSAKHGQRSSQLGGLPGIELFYEGERARWQVTIARGRYTDFVVFVSASPEVFADRSDEIRSVLGSFGLRSEEGGVANDPHASSPTVKSAAPLPDRPSAIVGAGDPVAPSVPKAETASPTLAVREVEPQLTQKFSDDSLGFAIDFPEEWIVEREAPHLVVFGGSPGSAAYFTTVEIQNISPLAAEDPIAAANAAFDERKSQIESAASDLTKMGEGAFEYNRGGTRLLGREFVVSYLWQGQRFSKWVIALPNPMFPVAHVFSYTAPETVFSANRSVASAMLRQWVIHGTEKK